MTHVVRRAVFLDRDGTLNVEKNYLYRIEDWEWIPGSVEALRKLNVAGWRVVVVTNQAGIARGYYGEAELARLHEFVRDEAQRQGAHIDAFYHCPHHPEFGDDTDCECRKPKPGMFLEIAERFGMDLKGVPSVGDSLRDLQASSAVGAQPILVMTGKGRKTFEAGGLPEGTRVHADLAEAVRHLAG